MSILNPSGTVFSMKDDLLNMIRNDLKIAWRNITRNKVNSSINIAGVTLGMASFILILLFVQDELKYDKYLNGSDHIYQVTLNTDLGGSEIFIGKTPAPVSAALARNFPEIENSARVYRPGDVVMKSVTGNQENFYTESSVLAVDSNFLDIFSFTLLAGDRRTCLMQPNSIVITKQMAQKYFGTSPALGKTLYMDQEIPLTVTGILDNLPSQTTLNFNMLASTAVFPVVKKMSWSWVWLQVCTYIKLRPGTDVSPGGIKKIESKFPAMVRVESAPGFKRVGKSYDELVKKGGKWDLHLQPFTDIHLYSAGIGQVVSNVSDIKYVYIFSAIALFIILLACVNFMNLSTAQASKRAKEVGVRKVLGSGRRELVRQFLTEALLFSFTGALMATVLASVLIEPFNAISGKALELSMLFTGNIWAYLAALVLITGVLAGAYPAFYLASFQPAVVIKRANYTAGAGSFFVRNGLVVFQFAVSTTLIICSIIVFQQLKFMQHKDLGLNKDNLMIISNSERLGNRIPAFKEELASVPGISAAAVASGVPTRENFGDAYVPEPSSAQDKLPPEIGLASFMADENFIPALKISMLKGRNFSPDFSDSTSVILNEEAAKQIGWKDPVGSFLLYPGNNNQRFKVIGIVKDFNINSLHTPVTPFAIFHNSSKSYDLGTSYIVVKSAAGLTEQTLNKVKQKWTALAPSSPFDFMFLDDEFSSLYKNEQRISYILFIFTMLSILVACLGLFGLAIFTAEQRTREIGIRKVLGASISIVVVMLSKDFVKLVLVSGLIAFPVAWYAMNKWLADFAYHISPGFPVFICAIIGSVMIALGTVSFQAIKAAMANPVNSLRNE